MFGLALLRRKGRETSESDIVPSLSTFPLPTLLSLSPPILSFNSVKFFVVGETDVIGLLSVALAGGPWSHMKELNCNKSFHG